MSRIGFIGTGHIAAPMVRFLADRAHSISVSERNADVAAALRASHAVTAADNQTVLNASDIIILCLRPHLVDDVLPGLRFREGQQVVSVMAGVSLERLRVFCAPASSICMTIPFGFLEHGGCPLPAYPSAALLTDLFSPENPVIEVKSEAALNQHFAICTMLPGVLDLLATGADWLGQATEDADAAALYTTQLVRGFLGSLPQPHSQQLAEERDALATQGTISLQMVEGLKTGGCHDTLLGTLDAIAARLGVEP